ncbi:unnamed protein product [Arabis nemorensis]|uniref:Phytocyanin domain-containing protein n=1 Tax=Arabis nemorensis TaxID=586526 RepID=A0A565C9R1_9BRAS|nr:unnamed protein product [Arabis nemorensis]
MAEAWSWSWGSGQSGSSWGWGWGSDNSGGSSGSGSGGSDSNSDGSSFGWGWSSNGTDTNWGWGSSSGSNHSSGTGSTHNNQTSASNHSSSVGYTHKSHTAPSNHSSGTGSTHKSHTTPISSRRKIEVTVWKNGFDYQEWVSKHAPFYINDVLVFKYNNDQTQSKKQNNNVNNDVYLLQDLKSYRRCDVTRGKKLEARGHSSSSSLLGFKLLLRKAQTYYLASGDHNGCNHNMKFSLSPIPRPNSHNKP